MVKKYIYIANWKMNLNFDEELKFATSNYENFIKLVTNDNRSIILCPSFLSLYPIVQIFKTTSIKVGAQSCSSNNSGSFTSQISAESLQRVGCSYSIIGHSETRKYCHSTDHEICQKFLQLINYSISPILCIGESLEEFEAGKVFLVLQNQLNEIFQTISSGLKMLNGLEICIAYEPVWAIGTEKVASNNHIETIIAWLINQIQKNAPSINWKFLYGGSINSKNIEDLKQIEHLDGFLIGKSSLDFQEFEKIVELGNK